MFYSPSGSGGSSGTRSSRRLRNEEPEYSGLEEQQNYTPKLKSTSSKELEDHQIKCGKEDAGVLEEDDSSTRDRGPSWDEGGIVDLKYHHSAHYNSAEEPRLTRDSNEGFFPYPHLRQARHHQTEKGGVSNAPRRRQFSDNQIDFTPCRPASSANTLFDFRILIGFFFLMFIVVGIFYTLYVSEKTDNSHNLPNEINDLSKKFPSTENELWALLSHAMNSDDQFVVLLVHDSKDGAASCLAVQLVEKIIMSRMKNPTSVTIIDGKQLSNNSNLLIELRPKMEKQNALVLLHLEDIPPNVAGDLHFILDATLPWIPRGAYVLTLNIPNLDPSKKLSKAVESFLEEKWSNHMKKDNVAPLITRIMHFLSLVNEESNPCKHMQS